jgi:hypothetical protein
MEARPPAENRHGGAPRGERPTSWDAPRLTSADHVASRKRDNRDSAPVGAPPTPPFGDGRDHEDTTRAQQRAAGTKKTALFDIVNTATANGSLRAPRLPHAPRSRVPGERSETPISGLPEIGTHSFRKSAKADLRGPRGDTTDRSREPYCASRLLSWVRFSFRSRKCARCTRPGHETDTLFGCDHLL